jgi:hypothetical protein
MRAIEICRTAELGGHVEACPACGFERVAYDSCRNRHCPKCQSLAKAEWLEARQAELLPVGYFHAVFTLPHEINPVALSNKAVVFDLLFRAVSETLLEFGADPEQGLGGLVGFTAILHTWDQKLLDHFHLHVLIPAGALAGDRQTWIAARPNFLFPVRALSKTFRGKFIDYFQRAFQAQALLFPGQTAALGTSEGFAGLIQSLWEKDWVVYCKASFQSPEQTLDYLGRYTHRVAISNHRLVTVANGYVTFQYRDRSQDNTCKEMTLTADEFIRRFLLHVLPAGFMRIRHFGFLANRRKKENLARIRELLGTRSAEPVVVAQTTRERMLELIGLDITRCPACQKGAMLRVREILSPYRARLRRSTATVEGLDSS